ncbi:hypothetical protein HRH59_03225, partial [Rheinheimera sp. YQF-2]
MAATKQDVEDFNFIVNEAVRLNKLINESYKLYAADFENKHDSLFAIVNAPRDIVNSGGEVSCFQIHLSSKAQVKLKEITCRKIKSNNLLHELTEHEYINDIKDSLYIHIYNDKNFDLSGCNMLLSRAYKQAKSKMSAISYFFPIQAEGVSAKKDFNIGSVRITHKDNVYPNLENKENLENIINNQGQSDYNCLLRIDIPKCSKKISKVRAQNVADFIYGVIKVFAAVYRVDAKQLVLKKNPIESNMSHHIEFSDEQYYLCRAVSFRKDLEEFWDVLERDLDSDLGHVVKKLTEYAISPKNINCLSDRLIDSFCWFGDASRDNNKHSQVVKLVTAMERLVTLSIEKKDAELTKRFCSRVSCLVAIYHGEIETWKLEAKKIYELRSDLVHGSQNLYKSYTLPLNFHPFRLASLTILSSCIYFNLLSLELTNYEKTLKVTFDQLVIHPFLIDAKS